MTDYYLQFSQRWETLLQEDKSIRRLILNVVKKGLKKLTQRVQNENQATLLTLLWNNSDIITRNPEITTSIY